MDLIEAEALGEPAPLDVDSMRAATRRLLAPDAAPISPEDLATLKLHMRGYLQLLVPVVESAAFTLPKDDISRACALAGAGEARRRLRLGDSTSMSVGMGLARSVVCLLDHVDSLHRALNSPPPAAASTR